MSGSSKQFGSAKQNTLLLIGFLFALLGFLNAVPDFGPLPSIGVFRAVDLHPVVLAIGFLISTISISNFTKSGLILTVFNFALLMIAFYALYSFNVAVREIEDEVFFSLRNSTHG